ncbi:hypothetical protein [Acrocarpospora catenulata]|uniref:hypothetical protein n=1 Tax=Acrocarpospora catenulata TaxID=2836182 RepID=UPI001BD96974|nr:hypothetical protein [Acrocarpospora catenulata]
MDERAAIRRMVKLAREMRSWCSPHGFAIHCSDVVAETILNEPGRIWGSGEVLVELERRLAT